MAIIEELLFQSDLAEKKYPAEKTEIPLKKSRRQEGNGGLVFHLKGKDL
jgi:hypothetical protein